MTTSKAILAGGCFWGMEDLIRKIPGVLDTTVGYTGGHAPNPTYKAHEGHAEAIEVIYDPAVVSYRALLEFFFQIHDPTTENRQGNDLGTSYRSAIFYLDDEQQTTAQELIKELTAAHIWPNPIVTEVTQAQSFYPAEDYHQDYLVKNPGGYTCHFPRPNWTLKSK